MVVVVGRSSYGTKYRVTTFELNIYAVMQNKKNLVIQAHRQK
jgi:hypothetical protein